MWDELSNTLINGIPIFLLIAVYILFMWRTGFLRRGGLTQGQYLNEYLAETKRHNAVMEQSLDRINEITSHLEKR